MRNFKVLAAVAAALLTAGGASAQDKPERPKEKKICKGEADLGSRLQRNRICRTKAEWEQLAGEGEDGVKAKPRGTARGN